MSDFVGIEIQLNTTNWLSATLRLEFSTGYAKMRSRN
jgi:hypothetical protein